MTTQPQAQPLPQLTSEQWKLLAAYFELNAQHMAAINADRIFERSNQIALHQQLAQKLLVKLWAIEDRLEELGFNVIRTIKQLQPGWPMNSLDPWQVGTTNTTLFFYLFLSHLCYDESQTSS